MPGSRRFCAILLFLASGLAAFAQGRRPVNTNPDSIPVPAAKPAPEPPDTTPLAYSLALSPEKSTRAEDTLPDYNFRMYDLARRQMPDWANLGNLGTAARPLLFQTSARRGFDAGVHGFDLYNVKPTDLRFFRHSRSYSEVLFSQGSTQFDGMLNALFSRTFAGGTTFSMDYRTINNRGQFQQQRAKHNALALGVWVPIGARYDGFLIFSNNINRQQESGGIVNDAAFGSGQFSGPINAEIWLSNQKALTRHQDQSLHLTQHLQFVGGKTAGKRALRATHTFAWNQQQYKFSITELGKDSLFFDTFLVDRRGLRNFISLNRFDNTFLLATYKQKTAGRPSDVLTAGLAHSFFSIHQEPRDTNISNLFLTGKIALTPSERFSFTANGELGLLSNIGEYHLDGELKLGFGKVGQLRAGVLSQRYPPALLSHRLYVSQRPFWNNDFQKPLENTLYATYALPVIGIAATAQTHLVNNYLYYDQRGLAVQVGSPVQVVQFMVSGNFRAGHFYFDNLVALQQSNSLDKILRLPPWFSKNSVYYSGKLFKKRLDARLGFDVRINGAFRPDAYQPLTWQFHLQDTLTQQPYPWVDAFAAVRIQAFRFFFRYENLNGLLDPSRVFYLTARHPQPFATFRLGISWRFRDTNLPGRDEQPQGAPEGTQGGQSPAGRTPTIGPRRGRG